MLELYHNDMSSCAQKVRAVLEEKGLAWTGHHLTLRAGDAQRPEYLKLNPNALVPTIVHNGTPITESTVICEYLEFLAKIRADTAAYGRVVKAAGMQPE